MKLLIKILIAIALGVGLGYICPDWIARIFVTFNAIFSQYLGFIVPILILGFVAPAIADLGSQAGKMLLWTVAIAYVFTYMSGLCSYFTGAWLFPKLITPGTTVEATDAGTALAPFFTVNIPPLMDVLTALVLAFVLGLGTAKLGNAAMKHGLDGFRDVIAWAINKSIIPLLPLYIFGIFLNMTMTGQAGGILLTFAKIILIIFALCILILIVQYSIAAIFAKNNPFKALWSMLPAYFTALGTASSAATIPVTLKRVVGLGVNKDVAGFTVPLCATIHMSGSTLKIVACALALMIVQGHAYSFGMFAGFIALLAISIIAGPGIPGGAIMASLGVLSSVLGFSDADNALMIALYIAMDSFGTACNVTGDGSIALIIDWIAKRGGFKPSKEAEAAPI